MVYALVKIYILTGVRLILTAHSAQLTLNIILSFAQNIQHPRSFYETLGRTGANKHSHNAYEQIVDINNN